MRTKIAALLNYLRQNVLHRGFSAELQRVCIFTAVGVVVGLIIGELAWTLIAIGGLYMGWTLWQIRRLDRWLTAREPGLPPDASGIWGDIFDRIYHLQKRQGREKKRLQSVINRVEDTTAALPDAVVLLDPKGEISWWNDNASQLLSLQPIDKDQPLTHILRNPAFIRYFEKGDYKEPINISAPSNDAIKLQIQITRYGQGERLIVVRDVTRLFKLEQIRKDFVANVSHELRTPLTVIKGYLETLGDFLSSERAESIASTWVKPIAQMQQQCNRMTLLINDLITLSRLETEDRDANQTAVSVRALVNNVRSEAEAVAGDDYNISVDCECDDAITGIQKELHSAVSNLVINAVKYSPKGSDINIHAYRDDKGCYIAVTDNGIGIDPIHIPRLTERFYRVDTSRSINTGGTGLGLAIVKHILLRHDAQLHIDSELNKGSTFTCHFPISRIAREAA
ncbi:phosphate regulon sensor histidine kinase PhoR [Aurantivibrio plasticivorans]